MAESDSLVVRVRENGELRVGFARREDRYVHAVECRTPTGELLVQLGSVEGTADDLWPSSPPLQQLHFEQRSDGRRVALLVGMAGRGHWSMSVEPLGTGDGFLFDVACRVGLQPERLGSEYEFRSCLADPVQVARLGLVSLPTEKQPLARFVSDVSLSRWRVDVAAAPERFPATIRWRYQIQLQLGEVEAAPDGSSRARPA